MGGTVGKGGWRAGGRLLSFVITDFGISWWRLIEFTLMYKLAHTHTHTHTHISEAIEGCSCNGQWASYA